MSEEITNAAVAVPTSIMLSVLINGSLGFGMLMAMLFCMGDIGAALKSPTGYPFMAIFLQATGSVAGTAVMASIITTMGITTSVGMLASASRQLRPRNSWVESLEPSSWRDCCAYLFRFTNNSRRLPPRHHQHRIRCRIQRPCRHVNLGSLHVVHGCRRPLALETLHG